MVRHRNQWSIQLLIDQKSMFCWTAIYYGETVLRKFIKRIGNSLAVSRCYCYNNHYIYEYNAIICLLMEYSIHLVRFYSYLKTQIKYFCIIRLAHFCHHAEKSPDTRTRLQLKSSNDSRVRREFLVPWIARVTRLAGMANEQCLTTARHTDGNPFAVSVTGVTVSRDNRKPKIQCVLYSCTPISQMRR